MRIYKNGVLANSATWSASYNPVASTQTLYIGFGYAGYFRGTLDEIRLYSRVLSATESQEHHQAVYNNENNLISLWHFDEPSGNISDSSNYVNSGTVVGATRISNGLQWQSSYNWQAKAIGPGGSTYSNTTNSNTMPLCQPTKPGLVLNSFCNAVNNLPNVTLKWSYTTVTVKYEIYRDGILIKTINQGDSEFTLRTWTDNNGGAGLTQGANYTYYIKAIGQTGLTNQSDSISVATPSCAGPSQPQNLTATFACGGTGNSYPRVNLSWSTSTNATSYTIYRSPSSSPFPVSTTLTSYTDTAVSVNTAYSYYVIAYGPGGASLPSDIAATTTGYCSPSTPSITSLTTDCENNAPVNIISWSDATTYNTFEYKIYRSTNTTLPETSHKTITFGMTEFSSRVWKDNIDLAGLTDYYYWVKAVGPKGEKISAVSDPKKTYSCQPPPAPTLGLTSACTSGNNPITLLNWNKTSETTSYQLYKNGALFKTLTPSSGAYLRDWLIIGPFAYTFDNTGNTGSTYNAFHYDFLKGEATIKPRASEVTEGKTWTQYNSSGDLINFNSIFSPNQYVIAYAFAYLYSPNNQSAKLKIGSDDGIKVFLNGQKVADYYVWRGAAPDQNTIDINLQSGINTLLVKVQEGYGDWGFYARITDASGKDILNNMTYWDSSAATGVGANYSVTAIGPGGTSPSSNPVSSTPLNCLPVKPDLTVTVQCQEENVQLFLDWSEDSNTSYWTIYKKRGEEPYSILTNVSPPQTDFTDEDVESGITYEYYLTAVGVGVNTNSDAVSETAVFCYSKPSKPVISATSTCYGYSSRIKINWQTDPAGNTISYNVWRKNTFLLEPDFTKIFSDLPGTATQYIDTVAEANNYIYKVEAVGSGTGNTVFSDPSNEVTSYECSKIPPFPPTLSLNLVYSVDHQVAVSIGWSDAGNEENYKVFRRLDGETEFANSGQNWWKKIINILFDKILAAYENPLVTLDSDILNYVDYTVTDGQTYEYQVMALNTNGETLSNIIQVAVPIARPGEFDLSALRLPDYRVYLTWTEALSSVAGGAVTYDVLRSNTLTFDSFLVVCPGVVDPRECYDNDPPLLSAVYYKAIATNIGGITESDIVRVGLPAPIWKEIMPW